jgi:hypothetical protein
MSDESKEDKVGINQKQSLDEADETSIDREKNAIEINELVIDSNERIMSVQRKNFIKEEVDEAEEDDLNDEKVYYEEENEEKLDDDEDEEDQDEDKDYPNPFEQHYYAPYEQVDKYDINYLNEQTDHVETRPLSVIAPKLVQHDDVQIEISSTPAFQCLEEVFL